MTILNPCILTISPFVLERENDEERDDDLPFLSITLSAAGLDCHASIQLSQGRGSVAPPDFKDQRQRTGVSALLQFALEVVFDQVEEVIAVSAPRMLWVLLGYTMKRNCLPALISASTI